MFRNWVSAIAILASLSASAQTIDRPSVKVGDECQHDVFDNLRKDSTDNPEKVAERLMVVTAVEGSRIVTNVTQKLLVSRDTDDLEAGSLVYDQDFNVVEKNGRKFEPAYPDRFYPLTPGAERKDVKVRYERLSGKGVTDTKLDGKASNWQKFVVPAGSFDAITITWDGWYDDSLGAAHYSGRSYHEVALSPATWCLVTSTSKVYHRKGGITADRTYKLTSFKN